MKSGSMRVNLDEPWPEETGRESCVVSVVRKHRFLEKEDLGGREVEREKRRESYLFDQRLSPPARSSHSDAPCHLHSQTQLEVRRPVWHDSVVDFGPLEPLGKHLLGRLVEIDGRGGGGVVSVSIHLGLLFEGAVVLFDGLHAVGEVGGSGGALRDRTVGGN